MTAAAEAPWAPAPDPETAFRERARRDRASIAALWRDIGRDAAVAAAAGEVERLAHGLYGAGGTFGFAEVSVAAAALEQLMEAWRREGYAAHARAPAALDDAVGRLLRTLDAIDASPANPPWF